MLSMYFVETIIPIFTIVFLSILTKVKLNKIIKKAQANLVTDIRSINQLEIRFSKLTICLVTIFLITKILDTMSGTTIRLIFILDYEVSPEFKCWANFGRQLTLLIYIAAHAFDCLIYFKFDSRIRAGLLI